MSDQRGPVQPGPSQPGSQQPGPQQTGPPQPGPPQPGLQQPGLVPAGPGKPSAWRHQARFLGGAFAVAAAVIAVGLRFAPAVTAYSGLSPWVFAGLLGFILVLTGACVLFAASLPTATHSTARSTAAVPIPSPSGAPSTAPSAMPSPAQPTAHSAEYAAAHPPRRGLTILGSVFGVVGLALAALAVVLTVLLPTPTQRIMVQFTDLYGRVQLEYCPNLPASFAATASQADLVGSSTILPVKVSGEICGDSEFTDGVWIYLNRASVTVSGQS